MGRIVGIDLGTTTSEIACIKDGKPEIIINDLGKRIMPSVVGITDKGRFVIGDLAKRQLVLKPNKTITEIKRLMGTNKRLSLGKRKFLPQQIASMILKKLKEYAENYLGEEVNEAVITVPANFNDLQRQATKKAGELAGLKVERIINEPTAAALAYGINNLDGEENILVYDLGGGTFDVTILELFEGVLDVKASRGNNKLGGKDFDRKIEEYILKDFKTKHNIDLSKNKKCMARIREAANRAKIDLSIMPSTDIEIPFITVDKDGNPLAVNVNLTRDKFESLIKNLIDSTIDTIDNALKSAKYKEKDIDVVLLIGGSSRICYIKKMLNKKFKGKIKTGINPDEAVALGAAVQAGIKNDEISSKDSILITDACSYTLGTDVATDGADGRLVKGVFDPIIMRDTKIPCTEKKVYYTVHDNQTKVKINVYEGEEKLAEKNTNIGGFILEGIPNGKAGKEAIEVAFTYNLNGILEVTAKILSTGKFISKIIDTREKLNLNEDTVKDDNISAKEIETVEADVKLTNQLKDLVKLAENKIGNMDSQEKDKVSYMLCELKEAVVNKQNDLIEKYDGELTELLYNIE